MANDTRQSPRKRASSKATNRTSTVAKHTRVSGTDRERMAAQMREQYDSGMSIRAIAALHGRSYGAAHRMIAETGALRSRGGSHG